MGLNLQDNDIVVLLLDAAVGAVLQNQLVTAIHNRAVIDSAQLPPDGRQLFVDSISNAVKGDLELGRTYVADPQLPPGTPPQVMDQLRHLFRDVFANGFVAAMRPTFVVPIVFLLIGALSSLAIERTRRDAERPQPSKEASSLAMDPREPGR